MFSKVLPKKILLVAIIFLSRSDATNDDYMSNDSVTTSSLDFFDGENSDEFFDRAQQPNPDVDALLAMSHRIPLPTAPENPIHFYKSAEVSDDVEDQDSKTVYKTNAILTTMVPDYVRLFTSSAPTPSPVAAIIPPHSWDLMQEGLSARNMNNDQNGSTDNIDPFAEYSDPKNFDSNDTAILTVNNDLQYSPSLKNSDQQSIESEDIHMIYNYDEDNNETGRNFGEEIEQSDDPDQYEAATTTVTSPTVRKKQGKQIQIIKLGPHEKLREYIEDAYIRTPLAALVDTSPSSLEKTKVLWNEALRSNAALDVVLLAFNSSGVGVTYSFKNTRTLLAGLNSIKETEDSSAGGNTFFGILRASELVPYDSAVFVSTATIPADKNLAQYAAITLLKKRIRLYLIWFGEKSFSENETQEITGGILGEVAVRSGGEILHIDESSFQTNSDDTLTLVSKGLLQGSQEVEIPVDSTVSDLHIKIDSLMRTATLETPNGEINLKEHQYVINTITDKRKSPPSTDAKLFGKCNQVYEYHIHLHEPRESQSKFYLRTTPKNSKDKYRILIEATTRVVGSAEKGNEQISENSLTSLNLVESGYLFETEFVNNELIENNAYNSRSSLTHENIRFPDNNEREDDLNIEKDIDNNNTAENEFDEEIEDDRIKNTTKSMRQENHQFDVTQIDLGVQSQLLATPGMTSQIYFEVTNLRKVPVYHIFQVVDERSYLVALNPLRVWIPGGQTISVVVTARIPPSTSSGTKNKITLTSQGIGQVSQAAELKIISNADIQDTIAPSLDWTFGNRCEKRNSPSACSDGFWTLEVTAQDWETGILRVQSTPKGILPRNTYTAGSNQPVKASYTASCCQPRVTIVAFDLAGNQRTANIDVRDLVLTEASIAAVVLGVVLLIILIILLVLLIVWCRKRRNESMELPSYRSHPERTR